MIQHRLQQSQQNTAKLQLPWHQLSSAFPSYKQRVVRGLHIVYIAVSVKYLKYIRPVFRFAEDCMKCLISTETWYFNPIYSVSFSS